MNFQNISNSSVDAIKQPVLQSNNGSTHRSTRKKSRRNGKSINQKLVPSLPGHSHNKSLVIATSASDKEAHPMAIYLNEIVSKNSTVSNNIILVSSENQLNKVKNTLESSNSSFLFSNREMEAPSFSSPKTHKNVEGQKQFYLGSKHSIGEKNKSEALVPISEKDNQSNYELKFPEVSNPGSQVNIASMKNIEKHK